MGIIICPSKEDLTSATQCPQPTREGVQRGRGVGPGWEAGHRAGWAAIAGTVRYQLTAPSYPTQQPAYLSTLSATGPFLTPPTTRPPICFSCQSRAPHLITFPSYTSAQTCGGGAGLICMGKFMDSGQNKDWTRRQFSICHLTNHMTLSFLSPLSLSLPIYKKRTAQAGSVHDSCHNPGRQGSPETACGLQTHTDLPLPGPV